MEEWEWTHGGERALERATVGHRCCEGRIEKDKGETLTGEGRLCNTLGEQRENIWNQLLHTPASTISLPQSPQLVRQKERLN